MIGDVIYSLLSNDATVSGIVGVKIFPSIALQEIALPYIVYEESNNQPTNTKDGKSELDVVSYDVEIYADNPSDLSTLSYAVRNCLDRYTGIVGGKRIDSVKYVSENTGYSLEDRVYLRVHNYDFRYFPLVQTLRQPTSLVATGNASDITLTWVDNATGETGYKVYRGTSLYDLDLLATIAANLQTYVDSTPIADTIYYYYVVPYSSLGNGYASNVVAQKLDGGSITFTFDNNLIAVVDTSPYNIDCSTYLNMAIVSDNVNFNGNWLENGTNLGKPLYENDSLQGQLYYNGTTWQMEIGIPLPDEIFATAGNEAYPWLATWSGVTIVEGTIENYCGGGVCADATYTIKDSANTTLYSGNIVSGGSLNQTITDSTVNVRKSDNVLISAVAVEAQGTDNYLVADSTVNIRKSDNTLITAVTVKATDTANQQVSDSAVTVNGNAYANVKATDGLDVAVEYVNGTPVGTINGGVVEIPNPITQSGIAYQRPTLTGQITSYRTGDDGWNLANGVYDYTPPTYPTSFAKLDLAAVSPFTTLLHNNAFGNKNRFTDSLGGQTYANDYVIDHLTGLGYYRIIQGTSTTWDTNIDNAVASTLLSYTDWRVCNFQEYDVIGDRSRVGFDYAPFSLNGATVSVFQTSTTRNDSTTQYIRYQITTYVQSVAENKTTALSSRGVLYVRNHY